MLGVAMLISPEASAQTPAPAAPAATADVPAPATAAPIWSVGSIDFSGLIDGYYSYNANRPSYAANGQVNDLYNFNDKTDQFSTSSRKTSWSMPMTTSS
jgi:hypothetical protein